MAPWCDPQRPTPARDDVSYQVVQRPEGEACVLPAPQHQARGLPQEVAMCVHQDHLPPPRRPQVATAGCRAFTTEVHSIVRLSKFKPDLPPRYDGTTDPAEFLQLYEVSIEAANADEKIMANWFLMALKDGVRSWILNLLEGSISSWEEMRGRFIANFQGTRDRPPPVGNMRRIKQ